MNIAHLSSTLARKAWKLAEIWAAHYWHNYPFGKHPLAYTAAYKELWEKERAASYPEIDEFEKKSGFAADKEWLDELALHTQIVIKSSPLCYQHGRVLYAALRSYLQEHPGKPLTIIETGTARGFSSIVMSKALEDHYAQGRIITFDLLPHDTKMYWNCIDDADGPKTRRELLGPWGGLAGRIIFMESDSRIGLEKTATGHVGFAFLDGAHTRRDVMLELSHVAPRQQKGDVIVFDDYSPAVFPGLVRAVDEGCEKFGYDKTVIRSGGERAYVIAQKTEA